MGCLPSAPRAREPKPAAGTLRHGQRSARVFLQLAPERLQQMDTAATAGDGSTLAVEARKIAEAADQFASRAVADCAQRIELAAASRNFARAAEELTTLRREIQELSALV